MKKLNLLIAFLLIAIISNAQTNYYVATGGDNTNNDGLSTGAPFLTLSHAVGIAVDGDIIYIYTRCAFKQY
jgi:hypothetical protein